MKPTLRIAFVFVILLFASHPAHALQLGKVDYTKATAKVVPLRGNVSVIQVRSGDSLSNIGVLAGPDGYVLVDHPEASAGKSRQERDGVCKFSLAPQENFEGRIMRCNDGAGSRVVANALTTCEPTLGRRSRARVDSRACNWSSQIGHFRFCSLSNPTFFV